MIEVCVTATLKTDITMQYILLAAVTSPSWSEFLCPQSLKKISKKNPKYWNLIFPISAHYKAKYQFHKRSLKVYGDLC